MNIQDPIADMINVIHNGQIAKKDKVTVVSSSIKVAIVSVLSEEGFIEKYLVRNTVKPTLEIFLKYHHRNKPVIDKIKRISRPGLRVYKNINHLPRIMSGMGIAIVSTSKGVMTDKKARKLHVGGEIMCYVS